MSETARSEQLTLFSVGKQEVTVDFEGGHIVTDAGLLAIAQLVEGLGILDDLAERWPDPRCSEMVTHTGKELLAQQIYQYLAGYFDFNDANFTRRDPLFQALAGVSPSPERPLASGSTVARFHHAYTRREAEKPREEREVIFEQRRAQIERIRLLNEYLVELFAKTRPQPPPYVILDLDGSEDAAHGQQQLTFWNAHYGQNQYFPLFLLDGVTGFPLAAWLRPGNVHDSFGAVETVQEVVQRLRRHFPGMTILVRGDGAFGGPEMLDYCDREGLLYALGYSNHAGLKPRTAWFLEQLKLYYRFYSEEGVQRFDDITDYQASSWDHPRRLVVKTEMNFLGSNQRVVVTNLSGSAKEVYHGFYVQRGNVPERPIGEMKNGLGSDRLSSSRFLANFQKLLAHVLSYAIVVLFREAIQAEASTESVEEDRSEPCPSEASETPPARTDEAIPVVRVGETEPVVVCRVPVVRVAAGQIGAWESLPETSPTPASPSEASLSPSETSAPPSDVSSDGSYRAVPPEVTLEQVQQEAETRRNARSLDVGKWEVSTLRSQLFKVGALVKTSVRRIWFHFSSHWPRQELFFQVCKAVTSYVKSFRQRLALSTGPPG
jgi:hypothetical protein